MKFKFLFLLLNTFALSACALKNNSGFNDSFDFKKAATAFKEKAKKIDYSFIPESHFIQFNDNITKTDVLTLVKENSSELDKRSYDNSKYKIVLKFCGKLHVNLFNGIYDTYSLELLVWDDGILTGKMLFNDNLDRNIYGYWGYNSNKSKLKISYSYIHVSEEDEAFYTSEMDLEKFKLTFNFLDYTHRVEKSLHAYGYFYYPPVGLFFDTSKFLNQYYLYQKIDLPAYFVDKKLNYFELNKYDSWNVIYNSPLDTNTPGEKEYSLTYFGLNLSTKYVVLDEHV